MTKCAKCKGLGCFDKWDDPCRPTDMHYDRDCGACSGKGFVRSGGISKTVSSSRTDGSDFGWKLVSELKSLVHACDMEKATQKFGRKCLEDNLTCSAGALKNAID